MRAIAGLFQTRSVVNFGRIKLKGGQVNSWRMEPTIEKISAVTLRLPLRPFPRLALVEGGHRQPPSGHECLSRRILEAWSAHIQMVRRMGQS
jgi:hypothetical protein